MNYRPVTAFLRPVDAGQITRARAAEAAQLAATARSVNKWEILRELIAARSAFGLTDRDLTVLEALLSFHPGTILGGNEAAPIVHPSNASICERLKGMACSTMRRHLARVIDAGFVARRDSPNGKRYARRSAGEKIVYGFDLAPLIARQAEICAAAEAARAAAEHLARLRETVSLMRRDLAGLVTYGASIRPGLPLWDQLADMSALAARALRRKPEEAPLTALQADLSAALDKARNLLDFGVYPEDMSINGHHSGQHCQNSKTDSYDSELRQEKAKGARDGTQPLPSPPLATDAQPSTTDNTPTPSNRDTPDDVTPEDQKLPNIPLGLVLTTCLEIQTYAPEPIRHWHHLVRAAELTRPMMGISPSAWADACDAMGPEEAAVVLAAMLERFSDIRSPGGYLRSLTEKAVLGAFSCGPMIMALMRKAA